MICASVRGCRSLTWPAARPCSCSAASTLRSVTGSIGVPPGSAKRSTMPKGAAANLASGGIAPVDTFSGKLSALTGERPAASWNARGSSTAYAVCSANGGLKVTSLTTLSPSALSSSNTGLCVCFAELRRRPSATLRGTGALKFSVMGRIGRHAACAFSRSQLKFTVNASRTWKPKRRSTVLATPEGVATPLPITRATLASGVNRRLQARVAYRKGSWAAALSQPLALSSSVRSLPSIRRIATRSPRPSTAHHTLACRLEVVAAPLNRSTKYCSSSMRDDVPGRTCCTKGPPVLNAKRPLASSAPLGDLKPLLTCTAQRTPGGRSFSNSNAHSRSLIQRPLPRVACASLQLSVTGAAAWASPKVTALSLNFTTSCRTWATSP